MKNHIAFNSDIDDEILYNEYAKHRKMKTLERHIVNSENIFVEKKNK